MTNVTEMRPPFARLVYRAVPRTLERAGLALTV